MVDVDRVTHYGGWLKLLESPIAVARVEQPVDADGVPARFRPPAGTLLASTAFRKRTIGLTPLFPLTFRFAFARRRRMISGGLGEKAARLCVLG